MRILVTGADGFIGSHACDALPALGIDVRPVCGPGASRRPGIERCYACIDLAGSALPHAAFAGIDAVVHLAGIARIARGSDVAGVERYMRVNRDGTLALARAAVRAGVPRFVYASSIHARAHDAAYESAACEAAVPQRIAPAHPGGGPAWSDPYGWSKRAAEAELEQLSARSGLELCILRLPVVYGPRVHGGFLRLLRLIWAGVPLPIGSLSIRKDVLYIENLIALLAGVLKADEAPGIARTPIRGTSVDLTQMVEGLAAGMGRRARIWSVSRALVAAAMRSMGYSSQWNRLAACADSQNDMQDGHSSPVPQAEGLRRTGHWYAGMRSKARWASDAAGGSPP